MSDKFQAAIAASRPSPGAGTDEAALRDDPVESKEYRAIRRVRTFSFPDVWFTDHSGVGHAFQWAHVRRMIKDGKGTRLTMIWSDGEVALTGRHLDRLEEDIQRRIIAEFYQVMPGMADQMPADQPVITSVRIGSAGEVLAENPILSGLSLVRPEE